MSFQFVTIVQVQKASQDKDIKEEKEDGWTVVVSGMGTYDPIKTLSTRDGAEHCARALASEKKLAYVGPNGRLVTVYPVGDCYVAAYQHINSVQNGVQNGVNAKDGVQNGVKDGVKSAVISRVIGAGIAQEDFWVVYDEAQQLAKQQQLAFVPFLFLPLFNSSC